MYGAHELDVFVENVLMCIRQCASDIPTESCDMADSHADLGAVFLSLNCFVSESYVPTCVKYEATVYF